MSLSIAVIIPTYNRSETLKRCVYSVLGQSLPPDEVIIVDDGSTDNTDEVVSGIGDSRIQYIKRDRNAGAQAARNSGIRAASSDLIAFIDSDDEWLPRKLELKKNEFIRRGGDCVVHCGAWKYLERERELLVFPLPKLDGSVYTLLLSAPGPLYQCILAKRECFLKIGFLDESLPSFQEWDTSIRLAKYYDFAYLDMPLMIYHIHRGDMISNNLLKAAEGWKYIVDKHQDDILKLLGRTGLATHYQRIGMFYVDADRFELARNYFIKAFVHDPLSPLQAGIAGASLLGKNAFQLAHKSYTALEILRQ